MHHSHVSSQQTTLVLSSRTFVRVVIAVILVFVMAFVAGAIYINLPPSNTGLTGDPFGGSIDSIAMFVSIVVFVSAWFTSLVVAMAVLTTVWCLGRRKRSPSAPKQT